MFKNNMVVSIKSNGMFVGENDGTVIMPFDNEYSIFIKNKDSRSALIKKITVDGRNVLSGNSLIVRGNSNIELSGEIIGNIIKNRFKFVSVSSVDGKSATTNPENGMISVEFSYEKKVEEVSEHRNIYTHYYPIWLDFYDRYRKPYKSYPFYNDLIDGSFNFSNNGSFAFYSSVIDKSDSKVNYTTSYSDSRGHNYTITNSNVEVPSESKPSNNEGKTVKGSSINEGLKYSYIGELESTSTTIVIKIIGIENISAVRDMELSQIKKPDNSIKYCGFCGKKINILDYKFCPFCGKAI